MADIILNVQVRDRVGTGGARATRNAGLVPGILYGADKAPVPIAVKVGEFRKALHTGKLLGHLVTLKYGEELQSVIAKDVQFDPVIDEPVHFDLFRVDAHASIRIAVPVRFQNHDASPGLKRGGALNVDLVVDLIKGVKTPIPRIENEHEVMFVGSGRPLEDAARVAFKAMIGWVRDASGLAEIDAYQFVSQNARAPIIQLVDPEYTVLVKLDKRRMPTKAGA